MKKYYILLAIISLGLIACNKNSYTINGVVGGSKDGMLVYLYTTENTEKAVDSTVIKDGKFQLNGTVVSPEQHMIIINTTPNEKENPRKGMLRAVFYLENSKIDFLTHVDSMPSFYYNPDRIAKDPIIIGSETEELAHSFRESIKNFNNEQKELFDQYLKKFHIPALEGKADITEGIRISRELNAIEAKLDTAKWNFIKQHTSSIVAFDFAKDYLSAFIVMLNQDQIKDLQAIIEKKWKGTPQMQKFDELVKKALPVAIGAQFIDGELIDQNGKTVKLSDTFKKGSYTMLEFWASWCGPCRGEIPHLKEVYKEYHNKNFEIISISVDNKQEDWEKALEEEKMGWTQLRNAQGFKGSIVDTYRITGVPYSMLINPNGKIVNVDVRGAQLNIALEDRKL